MISRFGMGLAITAFLGQAAVEKNRTDVGAGPSVTSTASVAVDSQGFIYIAGTTSWAQFPTTPGPLSRYVGSAGQTDDVFVRKLEPSTFRVVYSVLVGGTRGGTATGIAVDSAGNAYVTGYTNSNDFPGSTDVRAPSRSDDDAFVFKLNSTGTALIFSRVIGGTGTDNSNAIALGPDGSVTIAGETTSTDLPTTPDAIQASYAPSQSTLSQTDAFVFRLSPDGATIQYATYLGGPGGDHATSVAADAIGDMYVSGFAGAYFPTTASSYAPNLPYGGFVSKISRVTGDLIYSTYLPGVFAGWALKVDAVGDAYVAGTSGVGFPSTPGAFQSDLAGGSLDSDCFVLELDTQGRNLVFATLIGSPGLDQGVALALQGDSVVVAGMTQSSGFPTTDSSTAFCDLSAYSGDFPIWGLFVASFDHTGRLLHSAAYSDCTNQYATALAASPAGSIYLAGNNSMSTATFLAEINLVASSTLQVSFVVDSAGFSLGPFAPLEIISIFGKGLGPSPGVKAVLENGLLPTTLNDTQVFVDGKSIPLLFASDELVNAILPRDVAPSAIGSHAIWVRTGNQITVLYRTFVLNASPSFFTIDGSGFGQIAALNEDGSINSPQNPAARGSIIALFATGGGATDPAFADGQIVPQAAPLTSSGYAVIGLKLVEVTYKGAAPGAVNGVAQLNVRIPPSVTTGPAIPVRWALISLGPVYSQSGVTVAIK